MDIQNTGGGGVGHPDSGCAVGHFLKDIASATACALDTTRLCNAETKLAALSFTLTVNNIKEHVTDAKKSCDMSNDVAPCKTHRP